MDLLQRLDGPGDQNDEMTVGSESSGDGSTDAPAGSGHDGDTLRDGQSLSMIENEGWRIKGEFYRSRIICQLKDRMTFPISPGHDPVKRNEANSDRPIRLVE